MVRVKGFDLRCGGGRVAALTCPPARHSLPLPFESLKSKAKPRHPIRDTEVLVRVTGVEPARLSAREPKSRMSANSIIPAYSYRHSKRARCKSNGLLERLTRLELATSTLARWRSTG